MIDGLKVKTVSILKDWEKLRSNGVKKLKGSALDLKKIEKINVRRL
jgi:hypothetical protein